MVTKREGAEMRKRGEGDSSYGYSAPAVASISPGQGTHENWHCWVGYLRPAFEYVPRAPPIVRLARHGTSSPRRPASIHAIHLTPTHCLSHSLSLFLLLREHVPSLGKAYPSLTPNANPQGPAHRLPNVGRDWRYCATLKGRAGLDGRTATVDQF